MNCCDDAGRCHNGPNCAVRSQEPIRFAPGVISHAKRSAFGSTSQQRAIRRCAVHLAAAAALVVASMAGGLACAFVLRAAGLLP